MRLGPDIITAVRAPLVTNPKDKTQRRDWLNAVAIQMAGCSIQLAQGQGDRSLDQGRELTLGVRDVWIPPHYPEILHTDRILNSSAVYDVQGFPHLWKTRLGKRHHWFVQMLRREDSNVIALPSPGPGGPPPGWHTVTSGHGPPTDQIVGSTLYIDEDTGIYYTWGS